MRWRGDEVLVPAIRADGGVVDPGIYEQKRDHVIPCASHEERASG